MALRTDNPPLKLDPKGVLAQALDRNRDSFNLRFERTRVQNRRLDPVEFLDHLTRRVDPIIRSVETTAPERIDELVDILYDISLQLMARDMIGSSSREPFINQVWENLLPNIPNFLLEDPAKLIISISNAMFNVSTQSGARENEWLDVMQRLVGTVNNLDEFLAAGQVAAWRCGMPQYRDSALALLKKLPPQTARLIFMIEESSTFSVVELARSLADDIWLPPEFADSKPRRKLTIVACVGDFTGFGGQFISPPEVTSANDIIYAFDSRFCWSLHADCFGASLQRFGSDLPVDAGSNNTKFTLDQSGYVTYGGLKAKFPAFSEASSFAGNESVLAVTIPRSHRIFLVAPAVINGNHS